MDKYSILKAFYNWNPAIVRSMEDCKHFYYEEGQLVSTNPYHLENSVFTHTILVYKEALKKLSLLTTEEEKVSLQIIALCHDIGKVYTRKQDTETQKVSMNGHGESSVQDTIDFLTFLENNGYFMGLDYHQIYYNVLSVISNHMRYVKCKDYRSALRDCNERLDVLSKVFNLIDTEGSLLDE